jgi:asparagine synthase (glutamine-hydrolysing)
VIKVAEGIPFIRLTNYDVPKLYQLKGEILSRGIRAVTGLRMPVFPKRRFQHGAVDEQRLREKLPAGEAAYRKAFLSIYGS